MDRIVILLKKYDRIQFAVFAAKQVLHLFEEKHPCDKRPRFTIKAAENYLKTPSKKNKYAVNTAVHASNDAAYFVSDNVAKTAAYAATYAVYNSSAVNAINAVNSIASVDIKIKIIKYGNKLLNKKYYRRTKCK